jgi:integrase
MPVLTDALIRSLTPPSAGKQTKVYDNRFPGFGLRVTASGRKSFVLNYSCNGRERRVTIGFYPVWSLAAAREQASKLKRMADAGQDPLAQREKDRSRVTVAALWDRYRRDVLPGKRPRTAKDEGSIWRRLILPCFGTLFADSVRPEDVEALHRRISKCTPVQANRCLASLRHVFNKGVRWGLVASNPVAGVGKNPETPRERYLSNEEMERFFAALDGREERPSVLAIRLLLLTGCRKSEALRSTWGQFDLANRVWTKPSSHTKQKRLHRVPLSSGSVETLRRARALSNSDYVFPGRNGEPLSDIKKVFRSICEEARITEFRLHDLRHSYASFLISNGTGLPEIGRLLGHTQIATTLRYSHLADEPLRRATQMMSDKLEQIDGKRG